MEEIQKKRLICFDSDYAVKFGINPAILINYFQYYISKNIEGDLSGERKGQDRSFKEGRTYSYVSKENLAEYFPFFTESKVKTALNKLVKKGVLITGCFNKKKYDRTLWYAFKNEEEFLELPTQYRVFLQAQSSNPQPIYTINTETEELRNSSVKNDQWTKSEVAKKPMDDLFLTNPMGISTPSIGEKSPTIPINVTINQNKENTYLLKDSDMDDIDFYLQFIDDSEAFTTNVKLVDETDIDSERKNVKSDCPDVVSNSNSGKVGKESFSAASGSRQNADDYCSAADEEKLKSIFIRYREKTGEGLEYLVQWHDWVCKQQKDVSEIKHASAWIKSYQTFATKNSVYEEARKQESLRKKKEDELARRPVLNKNPYNDMLKPGYENSRKGNTDSK